MLEISVGNEILREVKGSFEDPKEATSFVWKLLSEYSGNEIWIYNCDNGDLISCDVLFGGLI